MANYYSDLSTKDPALVDAELAKKLEENKKFHSRLDEVIQK